MFRSILVPLDGSAFAEQALPLAGQLAQRDNALLELVRVHEPIAGIYLDRPGTFEADLDRELMVDMNRYLEATADRLAAKSSLRANCVVLKGSVAETLASHAAASAADLLVMTTQGRGPLGRMWFGSVADALVRQSHIPILLLRPTEESSDPNGEPVTRRVLVPLDGSQLAEQALEPALSLGGAEGEFTLLRVIPLVNPVAYDPTTGISGLSTAVLHELQELKRLQEAESHEYLLQLAERLRARTANVRTQLATHEHPAIAILDTAAKLGVDAIAMTTRGRGGVKRLLLGSVADKVLRGATTPVLISAPPGGPDLVQGTSEPSH